VAARAERSVEWQYLIHIVDERGDIIETVALTLGFGVGVAALEAAAQTYANAIIQFRQRARVLRTIRTGRYDDTTKTIEILSYET
jgi:hypothetical protein